MQGVGELKHTLVEVIIVYLVVDFATDLATDESALSWQSLVKPCSTVLIAGASWERRTYLHGSELTE